MKNKFYNKSILALTSLIITIILTNSSPGLACIDYHPTPYTTVNLDSNYQYIEIVVHNLHLLG